MTADKQADLRVTHLQTRCGSRRLRCGRSPTAAAASTAPCAAAAACAATRSGRSTSTYVTDCTHQTGFPDLNLDVHLYVALAAMHHSITGNQCNGQKLQVARFTVVGTLSRHVLHTHCSEPHPPKTPCSMDGESSWHSPVVSATPSAGSSCPSCTLYIARTASGSATPSAASAASSCASLAPGLRISTASDLIDAIRLGTAHHRTEQDSSTPSDASSRVLLAPGL